MLINYINCSGNFSVLETLTEPTRMSRVEKIGNIYMEKRLEPKVEVKKEFKEEVTMQIEENGIKRDVSDEDFKLFLKEKKIRGYALLKWESLKNKAIEEGFII